jgi:hypothetical protein
VRPARSGLLDNFEYLALFGEAAHLVFAEDQSTFDQDIVDTTVSTFEFDLG